MYGSRQEEEMRLQQFRKRYQEVRHHNKAGNSHYQMEINKFSDLVSAVDKHVLVVFMRINL